jgi:hypothetical protein
MLYPGTRNRVRWNPYLALEILETGEIQSPALGLAHELGHAAAWDTIQNLILGENPAFAAWSRRLRSDSNFGNTEERRNNIYVESRAAETLGEPLRTNTNGINFRVPGPLDRNYSD